jgi:hypothetical protein
MTHLGATAQATPMRGWIVVEVAVEGEAVGAAFAGKEGAAAEL